MFTRIGSSMVQCANVCSRHKLPLSEPVRNGSFVPKNRWRLECPLSRTGKSRSNGGKVGPSRLIYEAGAGGENAGSNSALSSSPDLVTAVSRDGLLPEYPTTRDGSVADRRSEAVDLGKLQSPLGCQARQPPTNSRPSTIRARPTVPAQTRHSFFPDPLVGTVPMAVG